MGASSTYKYNASLLPPPGDPARRLALAVMLAAPFLYGALALFLGADASWDLRNYHWYNPYAYLSGRTASGIDFMPSQSQFFLNPWLDVPFYLLATHLPLKLASFVLGFVQGLNFPLLFMLAFLTMIIPDTRRKVAACTAIAGFGLLSGMGISEIGTVFYDNVTSIGILLSALLLLWRLEYLLQGDLLRALAAAALFGLPAGLCVGLKMTCASFCLAECFALLVVSRISRRGFMIAFAFGCGVLIGYAITYGHWGWYLYTHYGNPTFPFFNRIFRSPLMPAQAVGDYVVMGLGTKLLYPFLIVINPYATNEIWWRDWRVPVLYVFLAAALAKTLLRGTQQEGGRLAQPQPGLFLLWMGVASYFSWVSFEAVYRYLLPLDMLAPLMITVCAGLLPGNLRTRWQTAASALIAIAVTIQPGTWGRYARWPEHIVSMPAPHIPANGDALVLMAGFDAYAHLLPLFPSQVPFLRIESRTFRADEHIGIHDLIQRKIDAHKGPLKLFIPSRDLELGGKALAQYHLNLIPKGCQSIPDNLYEPRLDKPDEMNNDYPPAYSLCDVRR